MPTAFEILVQGIVLAFSVVGMTVILRNAPIIRTWVFQMKKPWACNVCLPLWLCGGALAFMLGFTQKLSFIFVFLPGYALSYMILEAMARPPKMPFIPAEFDIEEPETVVEKDSDGSL
jgi:hypothetical protein